MHTLGIHYGRELYQWSLEGLTREFGKVGKLYYDFARGIDLRPVESIRIRKSVGCEHTLERDIHTRAAVIIELYHTAEELIARLAESGFKGNTLTLKVKFHDFTQITRSITQNKVLIQMKTILPLAKKLLANVEYENHPIRLLGLSVSNPSNEEDYTPDYPTWEQLPLEFKEY